MGMRRWTYGMLAVSVLFGLAAGVIWPPRRAAAAPDWKVVEQALGRAGTLMPGGVYRVGLPCTDLTVMNVANWCTMIALVSAPAGTASRTIAVRVG